MKENLEQQSKEAKEFASRLDGLMEKFVAKDVKLKPEDGAMAKLVRQFGTRHLENLLKLEDARRSLAQRSNSLLGYDYNRATREKERDKLKEINRFLGVDESLGIKEL